MVPLRKEVRAGKHQAGEYEALILPMDWNATNPEGKPGIIALHGRGSSYEQWLAAPYMQHVPNALAEAGYPVLAISQGGTTVWGNPASRTAMGNAKTRLQSAAVGAAPGPIVVLAFSMGALTGLNYERDHPGEVLCHALLLPVVDLAYEHANNVNGYAAEIVTAYGGVTPPPASSDPMQNTAFHAAGAPIKMWRSSNDTSAITARQDAFRDAVGAQFQDLGPVVHQPLSVDASQVVAFVEAHT